MTSTKGSIGKFFLGAAVAAFAMAGTGAEAVTGKICIDPGHGGSDPGAVGNGQQEKANVLDTGNRLKTWLDTDTGDTGGGGSWTVIRTRSTDVFVSLTGRSSFANSNGANRFMSIHNNGFGVSSANGIETFAYTSGSSNSFDLRNKVQAEAIGVWPLTNRGNKTANFSVLRNTNMPAELHEMGFITNSTDASYLGSATQRDLHAKSEMWALQRHYGLAKYTPSTAVVLTVDNTDGGFTPGSGWWTSTSTAGYFGSNYRVRGTASVSDASTWSFSVPSSGTYKVEAWWTAGGNRSATAPYLVDHSGGTTTVSTNQQANGGKWNSLGNYSFNSGTRTVRLSCWTTSGFYVIADAVRLTKL